MSSLFGLSFGGGKKQDIVTQAQIRKEIQSFYEKPVTRVSIELVASIVVVMVFALFALRPTLLTMSELLAEIEEKRELNEALQQKVAALSTAQNEWSVRESEVEKLRSAFFINPSLEEILLYLEYIARDENIVVESISPPKGIMVELDDQNADVLNTRLARYSAGFNLAGNYESIIDFLNRLEQLQPLFSVESVKLQVSDDDDTPWQMQGNIQLGIYVYQDEAILRALEDGK